MSLKLKQFTVLVPNESGTDIDERIPIQVLYKEEDGFEVLLPQSIERVELVQKIRMLERKLNRVNDELTKLALKGEEL